MKKIIYYSSLALFVIYLIVLLKLTIFSFQLLRLQEHQEYIYKLNVSIIGILMNGDFNYILKNIFGNIVIFVPFGFLLPIVLNYKFQELSISRISIYIVLGILSSTLIEFTQLYYAYRIFDIDDIILNSIGALIGALMFYLTYKLFLGKYVVD